jgi:GT2 family glycosyltransferase
VVSDRPAVTVVVPTHRRTDSLLRVLEALGRQDVAAGTFEVVVVCDGLDDPSLAVLRDRESEAFVLRVVEQRNQGPAAARNRGIQLARGDLIVFLDDDVVPSRGLIRAHMGAHRYARDLVVVGPLLPPRGHGSPWIRFEGRTLDEQYRAMETGKWEMTYRQFYTGNASVRKDRLLEAGGFDETFRRAEDVELARRLHDREARFHFARAAEVEHIAQRSYRSWLDIGYRYGRADVRMGPDRSGEAPVEIAGREFHYRHPVTRRLVKLSLAVPASGRVIEVAARPLSVLLAAAGLVTVADRILGGVFNLAYWRGLTDELGCRRRAREVILRQRQQAGVPEALAQK